MTRHGPGCGPLPPTHHHHQQRLAGSCAPPAHTSAWRVGLDGGHAAGGQQEGCMVWVMHSAPFSKRNCGPRAPPGRRRFVLVCSALRAAPPLPISCAPYPTHNIPQPPAHARLAHTDRDFGTFQGPQGTRRTTLLKGPTRFDSSHPKPRTRCTRGALTPGDAQGPTRSSHSTPPTRSRKECPTVASTRPMPGPTLFPPPTTTRP